MVRWESIYMLNLFKIERVESDEHIGFRLGANPQMLNA